ncbi:hypothetical protein ACQ86N_02085 [Puia sp. P3]|uniref:hypothetical protein n=1 Tax=Puia sp. P3 TaxID=3423952 RepID=UPI003D664E30
MTRCILCYRCVFTADQLTEKRVHGILDRGDHAEIATYIQKSLDNDFIGNIIDVCPVGALTDKTFRFKNRVWFLKPVDAHRNCNHANCRWQGDPLVPRRRGLPRHGPQGRVGRGKGLDLQ